MSLLSAIEVKLKSLFDWESVKRDSSTHTKTKFGDIKADRGSTVNVEVVSPYPYNRKSELSAVPHRETISQHTPQASIAFGETIGLVQSHDEFLKDEKVHLEGVVINQTGRPKKLYLLTATNAHLINLPNRSSLPV